MTAVVVVFFAAGCQVGPSALRIGQAEYNEAIQDTAARQLLLNLVRLKYRESPVVLDVGSISAQFEINQSAGIAGHLVENVGQSVRNVSSELGFAGDVRNGSFGTDAGRLTGHTPDSLDLSAGFGYAERPTITYSPLRGEDFVKRMLTPISLHTIVTLVNSGWRIDRVLSVTVQDINGVDNVGSASGPTPTLAPAFEDFLHAVGLMRELQLQRAIVMEIDSVPEDLAEPIPKEDVSPADLLSAASVNARFRPVGDGRRWVLSRDRERPVMRLIESERSRALIEALRRSLKLTPDRDVYELVPARTPGAEDGDARGLRPQLVVDARSLLGVMFYLSQSAESPEEQLRSGVITQTVDREGEPFDWGQAVGHVMAIHASKWPPANAAVAVRKRGYWYYIRDNDSASKSTFMLLSQLFRLRAGAGQTTSPVLTLPVGR